MVSAHRQGGARQTRRSHARRQAAPLPAASPRGPDRPPPPSRDQPHSRAMGTSTSAVKNSLAVQRPTARLQPLAGRPLCRRSCTRNYEGVLPRRQQAAAAYGGCGCVWWGTESGHRLPTQELRAWKSGATGSTSSTVRVGGRPRDSSLNIAAASTAGGAGNMLPPFSPAPLTAVGKSLLPPTVCAGVGCCPASRWAAHLARRFCLALVVTQLPGRTGGKSVWNTWPVACTPASVLPEPAIVMLRRNTAESLISIKSCTVLPFSCVCQPCHTRQPFQKNLMKPCTTRPKAAASCLMASSPQNLCRRTPRSPCSASNRRRGRWPQPRGQSAAAGDGAARRQWAWKCSSLRVAQRGCFRRRCAQPQNLCLRAQPCHDYISECRRLAHGLACPQRSAPPRPASLRALVICSPCYGE